MVAVRFALLSLLIPAAFAQNECMSRARRLSKMVVPQLYFIQSQLQPNMMPMEYINSIVPETPRPSLTAIMC
ncbi:hypothetical protein BDZ89DRAFT_1071764 [Hymenopellis radicata]|nr:hypothetical protein BDZ89DRAFT_1071764 [Hymenopellis radicata]